MNNLFLFENRRSGFAYQRCFIASLVIAACSLLIPLTAQTQMAALPLTTAPAMAESHPDSVFLRLKEKMLRFRENKQTTEEAICLQQMSDVLFHLGSYAQAVDHLLRADKILRKQNRTDLLGVNLNMLGTLYYYNQQPADASRQFDEALSIFQKSRSNAGTAETFGHIGRMHEKQLDYDSAFYFQRKALEYAIKANDTTILAKIHENIGSIYEDKAAFDSAGFYYQLSLNEYKTAGRKVDQIEVINNLGDIWSKSGDFAKGLLFARTAAQMAIEMGETYQLQTAYRDIAQNYVGLSQYDSAYLYIEKSRQLVQSLYAMENSHQISVMQTLYDMERKNIEISRLNAAKKINTLLNIAVIIVIILLSYIAALVINRQKLKIRSQEALNEIDKKVFEKQRDLMESELKRQQLEEASLKQQLDIKSRELSSHILHLIQKNDSLEEVKQGLIEITKDEKRDQKKQVRQLLQKINISFSKDSYWEEFRQIFDSVHPSFMPKLQQVCATLTPSETRLLSLLKMNLSSADMATLLAVTQDSLRVLRYRTKKKLNLGPDDSLTAFVQSI